MSVIDKYEFDLLSEILKEAVENEDDLNDWENGFIKSILDVFEDMQAFTYISQNQWDVLFRIADKLGINYERGRITERKI